MPQENVQEWIDKGIPNSFSDPFTKVKPTTERELTAVLSIFHQQKKIDWSRVELKGVAEPDATSPSSKWIGKDDWVVSEYPLFAKNSENVNRWGAMTPDIIFTDQMFSKIVIVEAKIDSHFTFNDEPPDGQVSRYLEYLIESKAETKCLIVLCPEFNTNWYRPRMQRASQRAQQDFRKAIPIYIMEWDSIFGLFEP